MAQTAGVYMLAQKHVAALGAMPGVSPVLGGQSAAAFVAARTAAREAGTSWTFAIEDRGQLLGLAELHSLTADGAGLRVWIAEPFRRRGHGAFAVGMLLEFAFTNLRLSRVEATLQSSDEAMRRTLGRHGFVPTTTANGTTLRHAIEPGPWRAHRHAPVLSKLVPGLRALLDAELAAGNEILETGTGWPDPDSVFVRLRRQFLAVPAQLPAGIRHNQLNDPHWWKAEYASEAPRQTIAC